MCAVEHGGIAIEHITVAVAAPPKQAGAAEGETHEGLTQEGEDEGFEFVLEMIDVEVPTMRPTARTVAHSWELSALSVST